LLARLCRRIYESDRIGGIPVVTRPDVAAAANNLHAPLTGWDLGTFAIEDWYRDT
jgi:hypothetical protein